MILKLMIYKNTLIYVLNIREKTKYRDENNKLIYLKCLPIRGILDERLLDEMMKIIKHIVVTLIFCWKQEIKLN